MNLYDQMGTKPVILSPMAGYSDMPYRSICRDEGSAASITEFVSSEAIIRDVQRSFEMLRYGETERPIIFQIFGYNPESILNAAKKIEKYRPDGIDLNMGCSVKKVAGKGAGSGLLKEPQKVKAIIRSLVKNLSVPVSGKIRLGWDKQSMNYIEIARILEGEGAWAVYVHGRTKTMNYSSPAMWDEIGEIKNAVSIPVFGNGDVSSLAEAHQKMETYKVDGILIGRAAMGNPWIFSGRDIRELSLEQRLPLILRHMDYIVDFYGEDHGITLFRKHIVKYLKYLPESAQYKNKIMKTRLAEEVKLILTEKL
ncbi:MAG: tRNA dihydrouridine synthase DusB [Leptospirales bacterium]